MNLADLLTNFYVKNDPLLSSGQPESGFGLKDGAFYTNYEKGKFSMRSKYSKYFKQSTIQKILMPGGPTIMEMAV